MCGGHGGHLRGYPRREKAEVNAIKRALVVEHEDEVTPEQLRQALTAEENPPKHLSE